MEKIPGVLDGIYLVSPQTVEHSELSLESDCVVAGVSEVTPDLIDNRCKSFLQTIIRNLASIDYFSKKPTDYLASSYVSLSDEDEEVRIL